MPLTTNLTVFSTRPGLISEGGEWNLIHSRNEILTGHYGLSLKMVVLLPTTSGSTRPRHFETAGYPIETHFYPPGRRTLIRLFSELFSQSCAGRPNTPLVFTGRGPELLATSMFQSFPGPLIADIHGDMSELHEASTPRRYLWDRTRSAVFRHKENQLLQVCRGAFVVSSLLRRKALQANPSLAVFVVPCACSENLDFDQYLCHRRSWRALLGLNENDIVIAYSGGLDPWQCFQEHLRFIAECQRFSDRVRAMFFTTSVPSNVSSMLRRYGVDPETVTFRCLDRSEVVPALCAGDIGLLLRRHATLNHAAFPNKFDEYLAAGLHVVTSPALIDVCTFLLQHPALGTLSEPRQARGAARQTLERVLRQRPMSMEHYRSIQLKRETFGMRTTLKKFVEYCRNHFAI